MDIITQCAKQASLEKGCEIDEDGLLCVFSYEDAITVCQWMLKEVHNFSVEVVDENYIMIGVED